MAAMRPSLMADVGFDDAPMVEDDGVGDDGVGRALRARDLALPHAVADDLAAAEFHLLAIDGEVLLDLDEEFGVGEPHPVAGGRAEHVGVGGAGEGGAGVAGHGRLGVGRRRSGRQKSKIGVGGGVAVESHSRLATRVPVDLADEAIREAAGSASRRALRLPERTRDAQ